MNTTPLTQRYDFVMYFDVTDGNPNGDPDAGNLPRIDVETGMGLVTDVCLKRKIRNFVQIAKGEEQGYDIFIKEKAILNNLIAEAHQSIASKDALKEGKSKKNSDKKNNNELLARQLMCNKYFDVRTFGAVMSTGENAGQVRGPIQLTFARSVDPIFTSEHSITRMAVTNEKDSEKERTMGRKYTVPYGLYRLHGFISGNLAKQTGFSVEDLELFWQALSVMFDHDRSAARGLMATRKLIVFKHDSELGNAPAHQLFDLVTAEKKDPATPARSYSDYNISINKVALPKGVEVIEKI